jgi:antitoxin HigA-1
MPEYKAVRDPGRCPSHPGVLIADIIPDTGKTKAEIARLLGISRQHLYGLIDARKPVSPGIAVRLAKAFGGSTESWLRMQAAHDAWHAEREIDVSGIPNIRAA